MMYTFPFHSALAESFFYYKNKPDCRQAGLIFVSAKGGRVGEGAKGLGVNASKPRLLYINLFLSISLIILSVSASATIIF